MEAELIAVCHAFPASVPCAAAFEEAELRVWESVNKLGCEVLGTWAEGLDDGALRGERAKLVPGASHGAHRASLVPVDESLVNDFLTRPAAKLGLMMMGYSTGSGGVLPGDGRHEAIGEPLAAARMSAGRAWGHRRWRASAAMTSRLRR